MPIKVLLVDDDETFRAVTAIALESEGCTVKEAADGWAAMLALEETLPDVPDVIVSDWEMPGLDGVALCQQIRNHPAWHRIPFVIISAFVEDNGDGAPSIHAANCCLSKQLHYQELYRHLATLVGQQQ